MIAIEGGAICRPLTVGGRFDYETETFVTHALRGDSFDASKDGTGRGTPLIAGTVRSHTRPGSNEVRTLTLAIRGRAGQSTLEWSNDGVANAILTPNGGRGGIGVGAVCFNARQDPDAWDERTGPIDTDGSTQAVAFSCKDHGADAGDIAPTLRAMSHADSHANADGQVAVAFHENQRAELTTNDTAGALKNGGGKPGQGYSAVQTGMSVRRLTPTECERLQGFPDGWTAIIYRGKPAADGPRYKALGNSMAVPCMRWIGDRIDAVSKIP